MTPQVSRLIAVAAAALIVAIIVLTRKAWTSTLGHSGPSIWRIAKMTVSEARRMRVLQGVVLLVVLIMASVSFFSFLSPREQSRMVISSGLTSIAAFGMLLAIFVGAFLIPHEIEKRTIYAILSKPVRRFEFVLGKYVGALIILAVMVAIMTAMLCLVLAIQDHIVVDLPDSKFDPNLGGVVFAAAMSFCSLAVVTGVILLVSTVASTVMTVISAVVIWVLGSLQSQLHDMAANAAPVAKVILLALYFVAPKLQDFDFRMEVSNYLPLSAHGAVDAVGVGILYTAVVLALATIFFNDRQV